MKTVEVEAGDSVKAGQPLVTLETAILEAKVKEAEANVIIEETQVAYLIRSGTSQENLDAAPEVLAEFLGVPTPVPVPETISASAKPR